MRDVTFHPVSGHLSFSLSTVVRHFGVVGLQTVFWFRFDALEQDVT